MESTDRKPNLDLDAYLARIEYAGDLRPTRKTLEALHLAHEVHIPFENLDVLLGRPINLDLDSLQTKLVKNKRGGYCFEQNTFFAAILEQLGFSVTRLAARVRLGTTRVLPRSHMLLKVETDDGPMIADVGFGTGALLLPMPLVADQVARQLSWSYRLRREGDLWVLQSLNQDAWQDTYVFTLEPQYPVDFEVANHYVSTHPNSRFTQTLITQLATGDAWYMLRNYDLIVKRPDGEMVQTLRDDEELLRVLGERFRLPFPAGTRFAMKLPAQQNE